MMPAAHAAAAAAKEEMCTLAPTRIRVQRSPPPPPRTSEMPSHHLRPQDVAASCCRVTLEPFTSPPLPTDRRLHRSQSSLARSRRIHDSWTITNKNRRVSTMNFGDIGRGNQNVGLHLRWTVTGGIPSTLAGAAVSFEVDGQEPGPIGMTGKSRRLTLMALGVKLCPFF